MVQGETNTLQIVYLDIKMLCILFPLLKILNVNIYPRYLLRYLLVSYSTMLVYLLYLWIFLVGLHF